MTENTGEKGTKQRLSTRRLNEMGLAFMSAGTLIAAMELDLFSQLSDNPATIEQIAQKLDINDRAAEKLVVACASLDLLLKEGEKYQNHPEVDKYLVKGKPSYFGDYLLHLAKSSYDMWGKVADALRRKTPTGAQGQYIAMAQNPAAGRALTEAGYTGSQGGARLLAKLYDFSPYSTLLDLGGGSAVYSISAVQKYPQLQAMVFDFETVCVVAEEFVARAGLSDRIKTVAGNFIDDDLPRGADVILLSGNLQAYGSPTAETVVKKAYDALPSGGGMIVLDYMLNDEKTGPLVSAFISLSQIFTSDEGKVHTGAEISGYLEKAGFTGIEVSEFVPGSLGKVTASKP